jgi:glycerol uptake facilitator-like aquaporin
VIAPIPYQSSWWLQNLVMEVFYNFIYITVMLVLPYLLEVNRISTKAVSLPLVPLFLLKAPLDTCTFNPAIVYALWYVNHCTALFSGFSVLPSERIIGPILGAVLAGVFCNIYFPDDPNSWARRK